MAGNNINFSRDAQTPYKVSAKDLWQSNIGRRALQFTEGSIVNQLTIIKLQEF